MDNENIAVIGNKEYDKTVSDYGNVVNTNEFLENPKQCKLVLFTGGPDVNPHIYGDTSPLGICRPLKLRDTKDMEVFALALTNEIKMVGICRGSQFIHAMAGGKLAHHINGHNATVHKFGCFKDDKIFDINSYHHQMILPFGGSHIIGWSDFKLSENYLGDKDEWLGYVGPEVEAAIWPEVGAAGVQYHPEWMDMASDGYIWFHTMVRDILHMVMDDFVRKYMGSTEYQKTADK